MTIGKAHDNEPANSTRPPVCPTIMMFTRRSKMTDPYDRKPLGFAYDGTTLVAVGYTEGIVSHWEDATNYVVSRTPEGEK
jgi:hypothetical protein